MPIFAETAIRPLVQDVANLMPDRTALPSTGELAGTFTTATVPNGVQVDAIIDMVLDAIDPRVARDATDEHKRSVRAIVTLQAAILTETTHFSDQGGVNTERIGVWERLVDQHTAAILGSVTDEGGGLPPGLIAGTVVGGTVVVRQLIP